MKFSQSDIAAFVDMMGDDIIIGSTLARGVFDVPGKMQDIYNGGIVTTAPVLLLPDTIAAEVALNESVITIVESGDKYQAYEAMPDGDGFTLLSLTKFSE